jgi:uncharacterized protein (TIGR01244 family)
MRWIGPALAALAVVASATAPNAAQQTKETLPGATNYTRVETTVACGGATTTEAYAELKQRGFAAVINLRLPDEQGAEIDASRRAAETAGLRYVHIPFSGSSPDPAAVDAFLAAVKNPKYSPVYIHCATANRVGAMWLVKRVLVDGWTVDKATAEAEAIGLRNPKLKQFALDYIGQHRKDG